jgi:hypothetical protein
MLRQAWSFIPPVIQISLGEKSTRTATFYDHLFKEYVRKKLSSWQIGFLLSSSPIKLRDMDDHPSKDGWELNQCI